MSITTTTSQPSANDPHDWIEPKNVHVTVVISGTRERTQEEAANLNMAEMHRQGLILGWEVSALENSTRLRQLQDAINWIDKAPSKERVLTARGIACGYMMALGDQGILDASQRDAVLNKIERVTGERETVIETLAATTDA
jgi:hypothetical protein